MVDEFNDIKNYHEFGNKQEAFFDAVKTNVVPDEQAKVFENPIVSRNSGEQIKDAKHSYKKDIGTNKTKAIDLEFFKKIISVMVVTVTTIPIVGLIITSTAILNMILLTPFTESISYDMEEDYDWRMTHALIWCIVGIISCLCLGCSRRVYVPVEHLTFDSISVHDTLVQVQLVPYRDSVASRDTSSYLSNEYGYSWAVWSGGMLHHSLVIWPQKPIEVKVPHFIDRWHYEKVPEIVEVEKPLTKWQTGFMTIGKISMGIWAGVIIALMIYFIVRYKTNH